MRLIIRKLFFLLIVFSLAFSLPSGASSASAKCPPRATKPVKPIQIPNGRQLTDVKLLDQDILRYLNEGGPLSGLLPLTRTYFGRTNGSVLFKDLNGDQTEEIALSYVFVNEDGFPVSALLVIFECENGKYTQKFENFGDSVYKAVILAAEDLIGIGFPQLLVAHTWIGTACDDYVSVIGWNGKQWENFFTTYLYCPAYIRVNDLNGDGLKELIITARNQGNLETGIGRQLTETYGWDGAQFVLRTRVFHPSPYRIHVLQDAQLAVDAGDFRQAIRHYERAATVRALKETPSIDQDIDDFKAAFNYQTAFANFRLVTLWLKVERPDRARSVINRMKVQYPASTAGNEFLELAQLFLKEVEGGASLKLACEAVTAKIDVDYPDELVGPVGAIGFWGTANVEYIETKEACPFN